MSLHDRDPRLEEAVLAAVRARLAADPPPLGRTAEQRKIHAANVAHARV